MVGGLVKGQQIVGLENKLCHSKTRPLAAAKHSYLLIHILPLKEKGPQNIPELCPNLPYRNLIQSALYSIILIQHILLILRKIAHIHIIAQLGASRYWLQLSRNDSHKSCLTLSVAANKGYLLPSLHNHINIVHNNLGAIANLGILGLKDHLTASWRRRELHSQGSLILQVYLYTLQLVKLFYSGLNLIALCGLIPESLYKLLRLLNHPLLILIGGALLHHTLCAQLLVSGVGNFIVVYLAKHYLHCAGGYIIQKFPVVRYEHNSALEGL